MTFQLQEAPSKRKRYAPVDLRLSMSAAQSLSRLRTKNPVSPRPFNHRTRRNATRSAAHPPGEEKQQPQRTQLVGEEGLGGGTLQRTRRNVTRSAAPPPAPDNLMTQPPRSRTALSGEEGLPRESTLPRAADYLNQQGWSLVTSPEAFSSGGPHFRSSSASPLFHMPLRRRFSL